jgi:hypothetical protein
MEEGSSSDDLQEAKPASDDEPKLDNTPNH